VITHIQRFSVHDGPGIRTTVFLKGCQMHCPWCHNPETYRRQPEIQVYPQRCIGCRACAEACPQGAHEFVETGHVYHRDRCMACGACAETCYAKSLVRVGETRTAEAVVAEVLADRPFYQTTGGVTLSGGEPLVQAEFTQAILDLCRQEGIHTAIETNLAWPWEIVAPLVPLVDLFLADIKMMDDLEHRTWTGVSNTRTLENLRQLDSLGKALMIRTPVMAGVNDRPEQIEAIADFLATLNNVQQYDLLPYHPLGTGKYDALGLDGPRPEFHTPSAAHLDTLAANAARPNFVVKVAGTTSDKQHASS
jgi:pyruvate formate lyase activating enzyme